MKFMKLTICTLMIIRYSTSFAHKEWVHQYQVKEAYYFLHDELGIDVPGIKSAIDFKHRATIQDFYDPDEDKDEPFKSEFGIWVGAWLEDVDDPIWHYDESAVTASVTHFWKADDGDDQRNDMLTNSNAENAWMKARIYLFGGHEIFIKKEETLSDGTKVSGTFYVYSSLTQFYKDGYCKITGYMLKPSYTYPSGLRVFAAHIDKYFDLTVARKYAYHILGRVAHLLGDMSVPAHVRGHLHPCPLAKPDDYEQYMGGTYCNSQTNEPVPYAGAYNFILSSYANLPPCNSNCDEQQATLPANFYNYSTATMQGGLLCKMFNYQGIDQPRYLFYTLNQLTDHFPSGTNFPQYFNQDRKIGNRDLLNSGAISPEDLADLLSLYNTYNGGSNIDNIIDVDHIAGLTFNYSIRAIASLFFWFALETGQIPNVANLQLTEFQIPHTYTTTSNPNSQFNFTTIVDAYNYHYTDPPIINDPANNTITASNYVFSARNEIKAGNNAVVAKEFIIKDGANVTIKAGRTIHFTGGFEVHKGAVFSASIDPSLDIGCAESPFVLRQTNPTKTTIIEQHSNAPVTASTQRQAFNEPKKTIDANLVFSKELGGEKTNLIKDAIFSIVPNPNNGSFNITFPSNRGEAQITVSDITGHIVYNGIASQNKHQVELHEKAAGVYLLQVRTSEGLYSSKIIVQ